MLTWWMNAATNHVPKYSRTCMAILIKEGAIQFQYQEEEGEYNNNCLPSGVSNFGQALQSSN